MSDDTEKPTPLFERLVAVDVNAWTEKKGNLTYLSWAHAWREFKKHAPDASYKVHYFTCDGKELPYMSSGDGGLMCRTEVTACMDTHEMWLPVMDHRNKAIPESKASMFDVNKTLMRCLVKNLAMFGLGLYIYAGEDLPEGESEKAEPQAPKPMEISAEWHDWAIPFKKSERHNQTLGAIVMEGATEELFQIKEGVAKFAAFDEIASDPLKGSYWLKAAEYCEKAYNEAVGQQASKDKASDRATTPNDDEPPF